MSVCLYVCMSVGHAALDRVQSRLESCPFVPPWYSVSCVFTAPSIEMVSFLAYRETHTETNRETHTQRHTGTNGNRDTQRQTEKRHRHTETNTETHTQRHTATHTQRHTETHRDTQRHRDTTLTSMGGAKRTRSGRECGCHSSVHVL
jgi:hypothetical protein